jgi:hypothetical protein
VCVKRDERKKCEEEGVGKTCVCVCVCVCIEMVRDLY